MGDLVEDAVSIVRCGTTAGPFTIQLNRHWSPNGYDRAVELFRRGFYDSSHFFRVVPDFLVQFGLSYTSSFDLQSIANSEIPDDPQLNPPIPFKEGTVSYAGSGENSRTSQLFISYGDISSLGKSAWETPIGKVIEGMENVHSFHSYGDMPPWGEGPEQNRIRVEGRRYMEERFPLADRFLKCTVKPLDHSKKEESSSSNVVPNVDESVRKPMKEQVINLDQDDVPRRPEVGINAIRRRMEVDNLLSMKSVPQGNSVAFYIILVVVLVALVGFLVSPSFRKKKMAKNV